MPDVEQWALYQGGVLENRLICKLEVHLFSCFLVQLLPGGTAFVYQLLPAQFVEPVAHRISVKAVFAKIVKLMLNAVAVQPLTGFFDGVTVLNAVQGDQDRAPFCLILWGA